VIAPLSALHYLVMIPVQLEYTAPAGCPTQTEFVQLVAGRGGDFAHPGAGTHARAMVVTLRRDANEHAGQLQLRLGDETSDARQLRAATCAAVAEGLAVVAAIALRGSEDGAAPVPPTSPAAAEPVVPATAERAPVAPVAPVAARDSRLRSLGLWRSEEVPVTAGPLRVEHEFSARLSGGVTLGVIPGVVLPRYDLSLTRTNFITTPEQNGFLIGNVFGVRWSFLGDATRRNGDYSTEISGFKAGVTSCTPLHFDTDGFVALFCANFSVGMMALETKHDTSDYEQTKLVGLGTASIELDARYNFGKHFHVGLMTGGEFWVSKLTAERADGSELFHSRLFNANVQLGLGLSF
jgi:hypothetical protein